MSYLGIDNKMSHQNQLIKEPSKRGYAVTIMQKPDRIPTSNKAKIDTQKLPEYLKQDMRKIVDFLEADKNEPIPSQRPLLQPIQQREDACYNDDSGSNDLITGALIGAGGVISGVILTKAMGYFTGQSTDGNQKNQVVTRETLTSATDIISSGAMAITTIALARAIGSWINKETPEHLKAKIETYEQNKTI
ncbi:MAG: hypothetical protein ACJAXL_000736 [Alphaproteobacteria bacterium]|jgi:hypothetical protein